MIDMINATSYLRNKNNGTYNKDTLKNFLRSSRVKYFIKKHNCIINSKRGRNSEGTFFCSTLFNLFVSWENKEPIGLLHRKEYEINEFILEYFNNAVKQFIVSDYIFDWFVKELNLLIEFNESAHNVYGKKIKDNIKIKFAEDKGYTVYVIHEKTALKDLARLCKLFN